MSNVDDEQAQSDTRPDGRDGGRVGERTPVGEEGTGEDGRTESDATAADADASSPVEDEAVEDEAVDEAVEDKPAHGTKEVSRGGSGDRRQAVRRYWPFAVMALCTLVLGVGLFMAIDSTKEPSSPQPPSSQAAPKKTPPEQLERFSDQEGGFTLSYPKSWRRIPVPPEASDLRLVLSTGIPDPGAPGNPNPTGNDGMWVRVIPPNQVEQKYTEFDAEIKSLTGDKPCGTEGSACLRQEQASVAGMNGLRFVYTSPDGISGQNSIHVQYFLRRNQQGNLYVIVFQAIPTTDLSGLAPAFDEVVASFQAA